MTAHGASAADPASTAAALRFPPFARALLWIDLLLCGARAVLALATLGMLLGVLHSVTYSAREAAVEFVCGAGIAVFGIAGNLLLLRRRRSGLPLAAVSLVFVLASLVGVVVVNTGKLARPATLTCEPEVLVVGMVFGTALRLAFNGLYLRALAQMRSALPRGP